jgi:DNA helicase-2/ATP-dependent DNA helicase PcrA
MELDSNRSQTWNYFDWPKNEKLSAKGILNDNLERMDQKARYISFGSRDLRMPLLISEKGYGLGIAAENTVMCCNISMYGPYIFTEGMNQIDYYFMYGVEYSKTLALYKEIIAVKQ